MKKKIKNTMTDAQRIEFAKNIELLYEAKQGNLKQVAFFAFLKGIATGFGVFLGGTIVVGLLLWTLSQLSHVPFIGELSKNAKQTIQQDDTSK